MTDYFSDFHAIGDLTDVHLFGHIFLMFPQAIIENSLVFF